MLPFKRVSCESSEFAEALASVDMANRVARDGKSSALPPTAATPVD